MKARIKIDTGILLLFVLLTIVFYGIPSLYLENLTTDNILDFFGIIALIKGTYLRMAARGHKRNFSGKGTGLVTTGLYQYLRNPMYLGTFLIGSGFLLLTWPWWTFPIYAVLFYLRFRTQVAKEENHLRELFGKEYEDYCRRVPRVFPRIGPWMRMRFNDAFNWQDLWSTTEKLQLVSIATLALILELLQQKIIFGTYHLQTTVLIFSCAVGTFALGLWYCYRTK